MTTPQSWTPPGILAGTGAVAVIIVAIHGAYKALRGVVAAAFDNAVWESLQRKSPELEHHMRQQLFADDLRRAADTREAVGNVVRLCEANATAINALATSQTQMARDIAELPRVSQALEAVAGSLDRANDKLDQLGSKVDYVHGMVDQMRGGVAIPPGARIPL